MSLPHECECRICGHKMNKLLPGAVFLNTNIGGTAAMPAPGMFGRMCIKHGVIFGHECELCRTEAKP